MKNHVIRVAAVAGLVAAMATPASAGHSDLEFAIRVGPAYVHYYDVDRYYDKHRRYDRYYRHSRGHKKRHHKRGHRRKDAHARWHAYNDGRWDRYYDYDHWNLHHRLGRHHRDYYRR